jgi:hypothetical protein
VFAFLSRNARTADGCADCEVDVMLQPRTFPTGQYVFTWFYTSVNGALRFDEQICLRYFPASAPPAQDTDSSLGCAIGPTRAGHWDGWLAAVLVVCASVTRRRAREAFQLSSRRR